MANYRPGSTTTNFLYQNNGDGTFTKLTTNSIVTVLGNFSTGVWGDWDNDGLLDLYVVEYQGANSFYRNQGNGAFARIPRFTDAHAARARRCSGRRGVG